MEKKWYQRNWVIALLLYFCFPVGVYLMWKYSSWPSIIKKVISGLAILVVCVIGIDLIGQDYSSKPNVPVLTEEEYYNEGKAFLSEKQYAEASAYLSQLDSYKDAADLKQYADDMVRLAEIEQEIDVAKEDTQAELIEELKGIRLNSKYDNVKSLAAFHMVKAYYLQGDYSNANTAYHMAKVNDSEYDIDLAVIKAESLFQRIRTGAEYPIEEYRNVKVDIFKYGNFKISMPAEDTLKVSCELSDRANNAADGWIGKKIESSSVKYDFSIPKNAISNGSGSIDIKTNLTMKFFGMAVKGNISSTHNFKTGEMTSGEWEYSGSLNSIMDVIGEDPAFKKEYVANTFPAILKCVGECFDSNNAEITFDEIIAALSGNLEEEVYAATVENLHAFIENSDNTTNLTETENAEENYAEQHEASQVTPSVIGEEQAKDNLLQGLAVIYPEYADCRYEFYDNGEDDMYYSYQVFLAEDLGYANNNMGFYKVDKYTGVVYYDNMATLELEEIYSP